MGMSNFKLIGEANGFLFATVDVTTDSWFWKKTKQQTIFKERLWKDNWTYWYFYDTGDLTPGFECERLEEASKPETDKSPELLIHRIAANNALMCLTSKGDDKKNRIRLIKS